jgi:predicted Fe-Mo cluster-binding NifX family protein
MSIPKGEAYMKIVVTAEGDGLNAPTSPRFGRCPTYVFVETDTLAYEAMHNPAASASGGAGIQAAQFVVEQGARAVLTGNVGPNAVDVLQAANIPVYLNSESTVRTAVEAFKAGRLLVADGANVAAHAGMGMRRGRGRGMVQGRSGYAPPHPAPDPRDKEISALRELAADLRQQLADVIDRIEKLERES